MTSASMGSVFVASAAGGAWGDRVRGIAPPPSMCALLLCPPAVADTVDCCGCRADMGNAAGIGIIGRRVREFNRRRQDAREMDRTCVVGRGCGGVGGIRGLV